MRVNSILLTTILLIAVGCDQKHSNYWVAANSDGLHDNEVKIELSDPFEGNTLAEALNIAGLEIKFLERPPWQGGHFVSLVKINKDLNSAEKVNLLAMTDNPPDAEYVSPDVLRVTLHSIPDGTPLRESKELRIGRKHNAATYDFGEGSLGGRANSIGDITIPNPFFGDYEGTFQYGPIVKGDHNEGISILDSEGIEYRLVISR